VLAVALAWTASVAAPPAPSDTPPLERIDRGFADIMAMVENAEAKLKNDVVGPGGDLGTKASSPPAVQCCANNVLEIRSHIQTIVKAIDQVQADVAARATPDAESMDLLAELEGRSGILMQALQSFATAPTKKEAEAGLRAMTTAFVRARASADAVFAGLDYVPPAAEKPTRR
jgi:hypothetical protein